MILAICRLIDISNTVIFLCHDACSGFREGAFTGTAFLLHLDEMTLIYCIYICNMCKQQSGTLHSIKIRGWVNNNSITLNDYLCGNALVHLFTIILGQ